MLKLTVGLALVTLVACLQCPNSDVCEAGQTCCQAPSGDISCCPFHHGECCEDHLHCCPEGMLCHVKESKCQNGTHSLPWAERLRKDLYTVSSTFDVPCDDTVACPDGSTCCKTKDGGWSCCPLPEAVCCDDFIHCCPHGKICNVAAQKCEDPSGSVPWFEKMPVQPINSQNSADKRVTSVSSNFNVPCNDTDACPDGSTCCKIKNGGWACCPLPEAVCCENSVYCCPHGKKCNVEAATCEDPSGSIPWFEKMPTLPREDLGARENKSCDSSHSCPESSTCCKDFDGDWSCCPMAEAVCCKDGEHCCPADYECNESKVSCVKKDDVIPWYNKIFAKSTPSPSSDLGDVKCDEKYSCATGTTCCRLSTGEWGCCPLPEAVCCPDKEHCCPKGYTCDVGGSCVQNTWKQVDRVYLAHTDVKEPISSTKDIQCGGTYSCLDGQTCCPTSETTWGCCPSPKAVCCDDMKHCCPNGYTCDKDGNCIKPKGLTWDTRN